MNRRQALRAVSAAGAFAVAGCLASGSGDDPTDTPDGDTDDPTASDRPADTRSDAQTRSPTDVHTARTDWSDGTASSTDTSDASHVDTVAGTPPGDGDPSATPTAPTDKAFEVLERGCGGQDDSATVSFDDGVTVSGAIWGNDGCYTARLVETRSGADTLTVVVESEPEGTTPRACVECIYRIDYEARFAFAGSGPDEVVVVHVHGDERTTIETTRRR